MRTFIILAVIGTWTILEAHWDLVGIVNSTNGTGYIIISALAIMAAIYQDIKEIIK